jgi:hypothetical protein
VNKVVSGLDGTKVSHVLFALRPLVGDRHLASVEIPKDYLHDCLIRATGELSAVKQTEFFSEISTHPWFRGYKVRSCMVARVIESNRGHTNEPFLSLPTHPVYPV